MKGLEYSFKDTEKKSKKFLRYILGQELYDNFIKDGKIEIKSGKNVYELYLDERVINKTTGQKYCIIPDRPDYPSYDILAIKYAWLKYNINIIEKVANKTTLTAPIDRTVGYDAFIHYMEQNGWGVERLTLNENSTNIATTHSVHAGSNEAIINVRCPAGQMISIMGTQQVPVNRDQRSAHSLSLSITDNDEKEIDGFTKIRIVKIKPSEAVIQLVRTYYSELSSTIQIGTKNVHKADNELYRWRQGVLLRGLEYINIYIINPETTISSDNIKFSMGCDMWLR